MSAAAGARIRMERATIGSIAIHIVAAISIPALAWTIADSPPVETISFTHIARLEIVRPRPPAPRPRAAAPHRKASPSLNFTHQVALVKVRQSPQATRVTLATNMPAAPAVARVQEAGDPSSRGDAAPAPRPSPVERAVASTDARQAGGYLPFGAEVPTPVLDPGVRKQLDALGTHVTLIVTVGDDGRTTNVVFNPPLDPQIESRIRALLADASWDPAVCGGGVSCEAQATIKL
jgi:hypothetical protein